LYEMAEPDTIEHSFDLGGALRQCIHSIVPQRSCGQLLNLARLPAQIQWDY